MFLNIGYFILIIQILLTINFVYYILKSKNIKSRLGFYFLIVFLLNFIVYFIPVTYVMLEKNYELNILLQVIKNIIFSIQLFLFNVNFTEYFERLAGVYNIYSMVFTMEILLSLLVTVTTAINLLKDTVINAFKLINVNRSNNIDIVLGDNEIELNYAKTSSNAIVWLSDASRSKVNDLIEEGYTVINKKLTVDVLKSKLFNKNKEYHFVAFNDEKDDKFIKYIEIIKDYILTTGLRNIYLHIEMRYEELETIRNEIISKNKIETNVIAFERYELISRKLFSDYPLTKFLPNDFILDNATINPNKKINIIMIGFGWVNKEIYRQSIFNNQYVKYEDNKFKPFLIDYHVFDLDNNKKDELLLDKINYKLNEINDSFTNLDPLANSYFYNYNFNSIEFIKKIKDLISDSSSYNIVYITLGNNYQNINLTSLLNRELYGLNNYHIFTRVTTTALVNQNNSDKVTYYGQKMDVLTKDVIVDEKLINSSKKINDVYNSLKNKKRDWNELNFIEMYNQIYSMLNIRNKYNLLGFDYLPKEEITIEKIVTKEEFLNSYFEGNIPPLDEKNLYEAPSNYFDLTKRNVLIYQEHLRWSAFYLINGYYPLHKNEIKVVGKNKIYRRDYDRKLHASLINYYALKDLEKYYYEIGNNSSYGSYDALLDLYYYDCTTLEMSYDILKEEGYEIIKL